MPDPCSRTFEFNNSVAPWDDPEMRWAVNYLIDRDKIVQIAYENTTLASRHFFPAYPPLDALVDKAIEAGAWNLDQLWTVDPAKAAAIFEAKGYTKNANGFYEKDGKELTMDITTHEAFIEKQRIAQVLVEDFQAAGINASTRNEAGATWEENFDNGNFETPHGLADLWFGQRAVGFPGAVQCQVVEAGWRARQLRQVALVRPEG